MVKHALATPWVSAHAINLPMAVLVQPLLWRACRSIRMFSGGLQLHDVCNGKVDINDSI
jgi:hypothetical protein